jgi:hypothetical protein
MPIPGIYTRYSDGRQRFEDRNVSQSTFRPRTRRMLGDALTEQVAVTDIGDALRCPRITSPASSAC